MRQQINLYQAQFHRVQRTVSPLYIAVPGGLLGILLLITVFTFWHGSRLSDELGTVSARYEQAQDEYDQLQLQMKQRKTSVVLERRIDALEREVNRKQQTLNYLQGESGDVNQGGFSSYLQALSAINRESIWLNRIEFNAGGRLIDLRGNTLDTDDVPRYLQDLGSYAAFAGKPFSSFIIVRQNDDEPHVFLASTREEEQLQAEPKR